MQTLMRNTRTDANILAQQPWTWKNPKREQAHHSSQSCRLKDSAYFEDKSVQTQAAGILKLQKAAILTLNIVIQRVVMREIYSSLCCVCVDGQSLETPGKLRLPFLLF